MWVEGGGVGIGGVFSGRGNRGVFRSQPILGSVAHTS